jgi:hypothetical protein
VSRITVLNIVLAVLVVALISVLVVLETTDDSAATTTTTTSTTTTTTTTTTTLPPTTTSSSTTSSTSSTTSTSTTTTEPAPLFPRSAYRLLVVNGSSAGSRLQPTIDLIRLSGYEQLRGTAGAVLTTETSIYYLDERFRGAAERLADDLGIPDERVEPFIAAPPIAARGDAQLVVYLGGS